LVPATVDEMRGRGARTSAVVDVDAGDARRGILIDEHERQLAADEPVARRRLCLA
jgi:hypothetical protein